jgi:hypothetical protein
MLNKKIFILINSDREFDYYDTLIKKLPKNFIVILNDHKKQSNYNNFKSLKIKKYFKLSEFLKNDSQDKFPILLSTGLGHLNIITMKSFLKFIYSRSFGLLISKLNIDKFLFKKFKRKFTAGGQYSEIYDKIQIEKKISKVSICFPRGLDLNTSLYPEKRWVDNFDYFLAHSYFDKEIIERNAKKIVKLIGYPRYIRKKKNRINTKVKKILWMPSYPKYSRDKLFNITNWLPAFQKLNKKYQITIKFHPKIILDNKTKLFFNKHINVIINPKQNLKELYDKNDLIVCDYGGSIFSAVYNEKPLVLLNNDIKQYGLSSKNLEITLRDNFYSVEKFDNDGLIKLIKNINKDYLKDLLKIKKIKNKIFGNQISINEIYEEIIQLSNSSS